MKLKKCAELDFKIHNLLTPHCETNEYKLCIRHMLISLIKCRLHIVREMTCEIIIGGRDTIDFDF